MRSAFLILLLAACGDDPVDRHIAAIVAGGPDAEQAKLELNLAKGTAVAPVIAAFEHKAHPVRARADLARALFRLYLREDDPRIWDALVGGLQDPDPAVRGAVARAFGGTGKIAGTDPLVAALAGEDDYAVRLELLDALVSLASVDGGLSDGQLRGGRFSDEIKGRFTAILMRQIREDLSAELRLRTLEWLEIFAEDLAGDARALMLKADLQGAEDLLRQARQMVPDSKNVNYALGRFYYDHGEREKGLAILEELGLLARARRLPRPPAVDGDLDEAAWAGVAPLTEFYQCINKMRAYPIAGRSEAFIGYVGDTLYVAVKGYEPSTAELVARATQRDDFDLSRDDCVEIFLDADHDRQIYHQVLVNSIGTVTDARWGANQSFAENFAWNGRFAAAARVQEAFWSAEIAIPAAELGGAAIEPGAVWGLNIARVRIPAAEYGQWAPTYGSAMRPDLFGFLLFD